MRDRLLVSTDPKKFTDELTDVFDYKSPPWSTAFPEINTDLIPCAPALNRVENNRYCTPAPAAPLTPPAEDCAKCPAGHPYPYGNSVSGSWCCSVAVPRGPMGCASKKICCLTPGSQKNSTWGNDGCEGIGRCGTNPGNKTACEAAPGPASFTDYTSIANASWQNVFGDNSEFKGCGSAELALEGMLRPRASMKTDDRSSTKAPRSSKIWTPPPGEDEDEERRRAAARKHDPDRIAANNRAQREFEASEWAAATKEAREARKLAEQSPPPVISAADMERDEM